jgi:hypothetical protein
VRSSWSAEVALTWLAVASVEGAWLTLAYIAMQWLTQQPGLPLTIAHFAIAVAAGMIVARLARGLQQTRFAAAIGAFVLVAAVSAVLLSHVQFADFGGLIRALILSPSSYVMGIAVVRGAVESDPRGGFESERLFRFGIPGLVVFWLFASTTAMVHAPAYVAPAFAATLTFVSAGLLALGLSRLDDLEVEAVDRAARRRWLVLLVAVVALVLIVGVPTGIVMGVPVSSAVAGVFGPLAPIIVAVFSILAIPLFWLLNAIIGIVGNPLTAPQPSIAIPSAFGSGPPPAFELPTGQATPDLTIVFLAAIAVALVVLVRVLAIVLHRPTVKRSGDDVDEVRASERIALPALPKLPRLRLRPARRPAPRTASEAYVLALAALAPGDNARTTGETPREHAMRVRTTTVGRDVSRLATDYQLERFAERPLTAPEERRALARWRRIVASVRRT